MAVSIVDARHELRCLENLLAKKELQPSSINGILKQAQEAAAAAAPPPPRRIHADFERLLNDQHLLHYGVSHCRFSLSTTRDFILAICLSYPDSLPIRIRPICKYFIWAFFFDDFFDDPSLLGADLNAASHVMDNLFCLFAQTSSSSAPPPLESIEDGENLNSTTNSSYRDLIRAAASWWFEFQELGMTPAQQRRFVDTFKMYAHVVLQQCHYRCSAAIPRDLSAYTAMRVEASGARSCCVFVEFSLGFDVLSELTPGDTLWRALDALEVNAALEVSWFNDLCSLRKEVDVGDYMNLVPYLYVGYLQKKRCGAGEGCRDEEEEALLQLEAAVKEAEKMQRECRVEARRLEEEVEEVVVEEKVEARTAALIRRYVRGVSDLVVGLNRWQLESIRYNNGSR